MNRQFEQILAYHCGPALAGIKSANLISLAADEYDDIPGLLREYGEAFEEKGIRLTLLCCCTSHSLILVYREERLRQQLTQWNNQQILRKSGYPENASNDELIEYLRERLREKTEFPHEIGVFLGYPAEDVIGFQKYKGKNFKYSKHWKVYSNVEEAKKNFYRFDKCRDAICRHLSRGISLRQLFCIAG